MTEPQRDSHDAAGEGEVKTCARCSATFTCGATSETCWCAEVTVPKTTAEALEAAYTDCLCARCLRSLSSL